MENKEIIEKFNEMVVKSWTYDKLTPNEKENWNKVIFDNPMVENALKGREFQKYHILNTIYHSFIMGCGYDDFYWRCSEEEKEVFQNEKQ